MIIFSKALADQATVWEDLRASESCQDVPADLIRFSARDKACGDVESNPPLQPGLQTLLYGCQPGY